MSSEQPPSNDAPQLPTGVRWLHRTPRIRLLDHDFAIRTTHRGLGRYLEEAFGSATVPGEPTMWYSLVTGLPEPQPYALYVGSDRVVHTDRAHFTVTYLLWHVNQAVIRNGRARRVLVHAAVAAAGGRGIVMPAASEAGKTTLVAGLIERGYGYLSDEAAAIDPDTLLVHPFPKPLSVDEGSWRVLSHLAPVVEPGTEVYLHDQWQVPPDAIRPGAMGDAVPVAAIVLPLYRPGSATALEPIGRAQALVEILRHTFHVHEAGRRNVEVLGEVVSRAACYRLTVGDLERACALLTERLAPPAADGA